MIEKVDTIEEQILDAAFDVFVEKGFDNSKMQDIADKAGIKRTVVNYYFRSKDVLYKNIAKKIVKQALPNMLKILNDDLPFDEKIEAFVSNYFKMVIKVPFMPLFIVNELHSLGVAFVENILDGEKPNFEVFLKQCQSEMDEGNIVRINPVQIPLHLMSLCAFPFIAKPMVMLVTNTNESEYKKIIEERKTEVVRMFLKGLRP